MSEKYKVMLVMPGPNLSSGTCKSLVEASEKAEVGLDFCSNGFNDMNILFTNALNRAKDKEIDLFAMLHSDVVPETGWLDLLIDEMEKHDASLISAVVPLKDKRGISWTHILNNGSNPL